MKAYSQRIGKSIDNKCFGNCNGKQNTNHLILHCKKYDEERKRMRKRMKENRLPFTLQALFCTDRGKEALTDYLTDTEICTAKWFITAENEEEFLSHF